MAEAHACLQAVIFAYEMGFSEVCLEGDALNVLKKLRTLRNDRSVIGNTISEINSRATRFKNFTSQYLPQTANETVHELATWGRRCETSIYWMEEVPLDVESIITKEQRW